MREPKMKLCVLMLPLVVSACASTPTVQAPCVKAPITSGGVMQTVPDWQKPLNGIISSSENG
ncbi:Rz1 family lipoprotein [Escherichia coli]|uniref:Rz1 family lipoprotein n=1 Tax=Escherichia coli TaxID=562 RepID=UPI003CC91572